MRAACAFGTFLLVALLGAGAAAPASFAQTTLEGPGVIHYEQDEVLASPLRYVKQGERLTNGGCRFEWSGAISETESPLVDHELAFDPTTCSSLRERGELLEPGTSSFDSTTGDSNATSDPEETAPANTYGRWRAYIHSWWEDPPQLDVSKVENTIEWAPDGSCAAPSGSNPTWSYRLYWLKETGWGPESHEWTRGATCERVISGSDATFRNDAFCDTLVGPFVDPRDTRTYHRQSVSGDAEASYRFTISGDKSGGCASLLAFDWETRKQPAY